MRNAYLALGSNLEPIANTIRAVEAFATTRELAAVSTFYRTPSIVEGPSFVNGVIAIKPRDRDVPTLITRLRELESALGRKRGPNKHAPRTIDIDLIAWPSQSHARLPHADIERYDFVARPLAELNGRILTTSARPVRETTRAMLPHGMSPLEKLTRELRTLVYHAKPRARSPQRPSP